MVVYGYVKTVSPLTVVLDSADTETPSMYLASYTPVVDDRVAVEHLGGLPIVLGKVIP